MKTQVVAHLADQQVPEYVLHLSHEQMETLMCAMWNPNDDHLDSKVKHYQLRDQLAKVFGIKPITN